MFVWDPKIVNLLISGTYILKSGFQKLWEVIVKQNKLNVLHNVTITKVKRDYDVGNPDIWIQRRVNDGLPHWKRYDFLVWTPEIAKSLSLFDNKWKVEEDLLSRASVTFLTTTLFSARNQIKGLSPINYWVRHLNTTEDDFVWGQRDSLGIIRHHYGAKYRHYGYTTENDDKRIMTSVAYQMSYQEPNQKKLHAKLRHHFERINARNISIKHTMMWRFFPRYSPKDMENGILWKILNIQGKYATWYLGSSVSFESIKSVIDYNKLLIKYSKLPKKKLKLPLDRSLLLQRRLTLLRRKRD